MNGQLELVHFQITRNCNLRCWFCGQWGKKGFFKDGSGRAMEFDDWLRLAGELARLEPKPDILLWGGEPLVYSEFDRLARTLCDMGFRLGMVTNGTLLHRHTETCRECFRQIYVSVDGPEEIHDAIRGSGVFRKVRENLKLLRGCGAKISINTVLTPKLMEDLDGALDAFATLAPDEVLLQEMIALDAGEIREYKAWLESAFGQCAGEIDSWLGDCPADPNRADIIEQVVARRSDPFRVVYKPHGDACGKVCSSPEHHLHVTWKGSVCFCTDFYDFSAGSVREATMAEIWNSEKARRFRCEVAAGNNPACNHCSWRGGEHFWL